MNRLTVHAAVSDYLHDMHALVPSRLARTTAANYTRDLGEFTTLAGANTTLDDLTSADIDAFVIAYGDKPDGRYARAKANAMGEPKTRGAGAQARFRQSVSRLFVHATRVGWVASNPMLDTTVRPSTKGPVAASRKALSATAAQALVDLPAILDNERKVAGYERPDMRLACRDEFLLRLLVEVGPRVSEICRANIADLHERDAQSTWLRLYGRGAKERWVPLSAATMDAYTRYTETERPAPKPRIRKYENAAGMLVAETTKPAEDAEAALLLTWRGRRMTPRDIQLMVRRMQARLPVHIAHAITPHGLRHTAASLLLASEATELATVQELLGVEHVTVAAPAPAIGANSLSVGGAR